jgi:hypothetical protein
VTGWAARLPYAVLLAVLLFFGWFPGGLVGKIDPAVAGLMPRTQSGVLATRSP